MSRRIPILLGATLLAASAARAQTAVPSGQFITPMAAPGAVFQALNPGLPDHPEYRATGALKTAVSPDGATLLVLTSGYNNLSYSAPGASFGSFEPSASNEYVFVYDIAGHNAGHPALAQVIQIPDAFEGLAFAPDGSTFYVSGGVDDVIYAFGLSGSSWARTATIPLGHQVIEGTPDNGGIGFHQSPSAAGIVLSADGKMLVVANIYNESISIVDTATNAVAREYDLRPYNTTPGIGDGAAGGETPFTVALATVGGVQAAYVSSIRDRELVVLNIAGALRGTKPTLITRIPMSGNPNNMAFDNPAHPTRLYVAQDNSDHVAVINLADNTIVEQIDVRAPPGILPTPRRYTGATPNSLAVSPNGKWLYVTDGGQNAVSVVSLDGPLPHHSVGLIPTGWYPQSVSLSSTGDELYIVNAKSDPGPNVAAASSATIALRGTGNPHANQTAQKQAYASNEYVLKIEPAGLLAVPVPNAAMLEALTRRVAANNRYDTPESADAVATMRALAGKIRHIIYIVKENRTFDQVLGDLTNGANVDPALTVFGARVTPNFHAMAQNFVTLDNFLDPAEVSGNGWEWSTAARETDLNAKQIRSITHKARCPAG
jgi:DNA-binding beta-propeller fold protein YncE